MKYKDFKDALRQADIDVREYRRLKQVAREILDEVKIYKDAAYEVYRKMGEGAVDLLDYLIEKQKPRTSVATDRRTPYNKSTETETEETDNNMVSESNDNGLGNRWVKTAYGGRKRFKLMKLLRSGIKEVEQNLGMYNTVAGALTTKHLISEFNLGVGGFMGICKDSNSNCTPMHVYDLNVFVGATNDTRANWPAYATNQTDNASARAWCFKNDNKFYELFTGSANMTTLRTESGYTSHEPRWFIDDPDGTNLSSNPSSRIYRKAIDVRYQLYGCKRMTLDYDVMVIRVTNPKMCPDYLATLTNEELTQFQQGWQNLVRGRCINPMLNGIEPGPQVSKWFKIVARKKVKIGEDTTNADFMPSVTGKIHVKLNEVNDYAWEDTRGFNVESGDGLFDTVPVPDDNGSNNTFSHKPYYTSRLYLVIRSTGTIDQAPAGGTAPLQTLNQDSENVNGQNDDYNTVSAAQNGWYGFWPSGIPIQVAASSFGPLYSQGSYDLAIQTRFLVNTAH